MNTDMLPFLQEGLHQYIEAKQTVAAFELKLGDLLRETVTTRTRWSPLKQKQVGRGLSVAGNSSDGYWIAASIQGSAPRNGEVAIDCGFWWTPDNFEKPIIYVGFYLKPKRVVNFKWSSKKRGIGSFERYGRTFLYVPFPKSFEIEQPLNQLLDALLEQLR